MTLVAGAPLQESGRTNLIEVEEIPSGNFVCRLSSRQRLTICHFAAYRN
jgi:hypothetical protein